jgi:hypothetical protein
MGRTAAQTTDFPLPRRHNSRKPQDLRDNGSKKLAERPVWSEPVSTSNSLFDGKMQGISQFYR